MKATKLMALGLVGLTTLGLASTANAEEKISTTASVTFNSIGNESGNQEGPGGEVDNPPVVETPNTVNGWKLAVPGEMLFKGTTTNTLDENGNVYNPGTDKNNYQYQGVAYANQAEKGDFFIRFEAESESAATGTYSVSVSRKNFFVTHESGGVELLDVDDTSYIEFPGFTKFGGTDSAITELTDSKSFKLNSANTEVNPIFKVNLNATDGNDQGFAVAAKDAIMLHIGEGSENIAAGEKVSTVLTWTFAADQTNGEG